MHIDFLRLSKGHMIHTKVPLKFKNIKKSNHLNRLVTLSPLTEMATNFHERNGAKLIQINETTQNFEYKVM